VFIEGFSYVRQLRTEWTFSRAGLIGVGRDINEDVHLRELADKIQDAICRNKFMIHFEI